LRARWPRPSWTRCEAPDQPGQAEPGRPGRLPAPQAHALCHDYRPPAVTTACAASRPRVPAPSPSARSWASCRTPRRRRCRCRPVCQHPWPPVGRLAAPVHRSGPPGLCRPRAVRGRP
jgi:hypothetical protein